MRGTLEGPARENEKQDSGTNDVSHHAAQEVLQPAQNANEPPAVGTAAVTAVHPVVSTVAMTTPDGLDLRTLLYQEEENEFDALIRCEKTHFGEHFKVAAEQFASSTASIANTTMVQGIHDGDHYIGINGAHAVVRLAYIDAVIRNYEKIYTPGGTKTLLNAIIDIYIANTPSLYGGYDERAYEIISKTRDLLVARKAASEVRKNQISGKLGVYDALRNENRISPKHPRFDVSMLNGRKSDAANPIEACESGQNDAVNKAQQAREFYDQLMAGIPFLAAKRVGQQESNYFKWKNNPASIMSLDGVRVLSAAPELSLADRHAFVRTLMQSLLTDAEKRLGDRGANDDSAMTAAYLYSHVARLFYQELKEEADKNERGTYLLLPVEALSLVYSGVQAYIKERERFFTPQDWLWQDAGTVKISLAAVPRFKTNTEKDCCKTYIQTLLQSAWLSGRTIKQFLPSDEDLLNLLGEESPWHELLVELWNEHHDMQAGQEQRERLSAEQLEQLSLTYNSKLDKLQHAIADLSGQCRDGLAKAFGDTARAFVTLNTIRQLMELCFTESARKAATICLNQLDNVRKAFDNSGVSSQMEILQNAVRMLVRQRTP